MLDFKMPGMDTPEGQGLLAAAFSLLQARKMPGDRGIGGALGAAGQQFMGTRSQAQDQMQRRKFQDLQMAAQNRQLEKQAAAERQRLADETAVRGSIAGGNMIQAKNAAAVSHVLRIVVNGVDYYIMLSNAI